MNTDPPDIGLVKEVLAMWGMADLAPHIHVAYSARLRTSLGRTRVDERRIHLNLEIADADAAMRREVLCHELAHIVVHEQHGPSKAPHGKEWRELVRRAGYSPRVRIALSPTRCNKPKSRKRYEHVCPVCQRVRFAARPMHRWRCGTCRQAGLDGHLNIRAVDRA